MTTRGTSNGNSAGSAAARRRRRAWLLETYRADVDVKQVLVWRTDLETGEVTGTWEVEILDHWFFDPPLISEDSLRRNVPACRCYRCGTLLTVETLTVDRIVPGCRGGTYRRTNIRPACGPCNSETGGGTRRSARAKEK